MNFTPAIVAVLLLCANVVGSALFTSNGPTSEMDNSPWAGPVLYYNNLSFVRGDFVVPSPVAGTNAVNGTSYAAWVGIDGTSTTCNSIVQAGIAMTYDNGVASYYAWYEWFPDVSYQFDLEIKAGDKVAISVVLHSSTDADIAVENQSTGLGDYHYFVDSKYPLCQGSAEWIIEEYLVNGARVPMADFGTINFTYAEAGSFDTDWTFMGIDAANMWEVDSNGTILTNCAALGNTSFSCQYIG